MEKVIPIISAILFFILGSVIGSFLNVLAYRIPKKESIVKGRSHCTHCGKQIKNIDLIPVLSYLMLGGKCRWCKKRISPRYMMVELLTACSYLAAYLVLGFSGELIYALILFPVLIILSLWDLDHKEIPYTCSIIIAVMGVVSIFTSQVPWYEHLIGAVIVAVPFGVLCFLGAMGGGDVQLMAAAGLLLGWSIVPSALVGIIIGALFGIVVKAVTKSNVIVFGPFLSIGIFVGYLWGEGIINGYLGLIR